MTRRSMIGCQTTRREFLKRAAGATAVAALAPAIVPASALGLGDAVAPSERVVMGWIGAGGQGRALLNMFMGSPKAQVVACADVDQSNRAEGLAAINEKYGNHDAKGYGDFRELIGRKDIDAVTVATPDHWHALASVAALNAGKDVYCEKPLANSVGESRAIVEAVKRNNRILQVGSMERSNPKVRYACELVRNGRIGKIHTVRVNLPDDDGHLAKAKATNTIPPEQPIPEGFDWNFWLGHTPIAPYNPARSHFWWRFILAHGGGEMTDRGAHVIDLAELGLGIEEVPVEYEAKGRQNTNSVYDAFWDYTFAHTYSSGVKMIGSSAHPRGLRFEGDKGWLFLHIHGGDAEASDPALLQSKITDDEIQLGRTPDHRWQFLDCVKSRQFGFAPPDAGHRTATICHLTNLSMKLGRKLKWDPKAERVVNDEEANRHLTPTMRSPWRLEAIG